MIHKQKVIVEWVDWVGVLFIVGAYLSGVMGWVGATDWRYLLANVLGSAGIAYSSWRKKDTQPTVLNLVWIVVAVIGLLHLHG
jgi:hypothetical protein